MGENQTMNIVISILTWIILSIPLHELGHYLAAKKNKWQNIHFGIKTWHRIPIAVMTLAENKYNITSNAEFLKVHKEIAFFHAMGSLFSLAGIAFSYAFGIFEIDTAFLLFEMMTIYMVWEIIKCDVKGEKQE